MAEIHGFTIISRAPQLLATDIDGEIVLMSVERGKYYGLENTARRIWDLLETPRSLDELGTLLERQYVASADVIERDVRAFLADMAAEGIITFT